MRTRAGEIASVTAGLMVMASMPVNVRADTVLECEALYFARTPISVEHAKVLVEDGFDVGPNPEIMRNLGTGCTMRDTKLQGAGSIGSKGSLFVVYVQGKSGAEQLPQLANPVVGATMQFPPVHRYAVAKITNVELTESLDASEFWTQGTISVIEAPGGVSRYTVVADDSEYVVDVKSHGSWQGVEGLRERFKLKSDAPSIWGLRQLVWPSFERFCSGTFTDAVSVKVTPISGPSSAALRAAQGIKKTEEGDDKVVRFEDSAGGLNLPLSCTTLGGV